MKTSLMFVFTASTVLSPKLRTLYIRVLDDPSIMFLSSQSKVILFIVDFDMLPISSTPSTLSRHEAIGKANGKKISIEKNMI